MKCFIVLPCYNEEENIKALISSIDYVLGKRLPYLIIAVNDGSDDHTGKLLRELSREYNLKLLEHFRNKGLAKALKLGLSEAAKLSFDDDLIVTMDSDNTHDPRYLIDMIKTAEETDIVIGSRYTANGGQLHVPVYRVVLSKTINFLIRKLIRIPVNDATSGFRCFKARVIRRLHSVFGERFIESKGFEVSLELLLKAIYCCNSSVQEVPIILNYGKKRGSSKMKLLFTLKQYLLLFFKLKFLNGKFSVF